MADVQQTTDPALHAEVWPSLPLEAWQDTYATLHMWTQIVGKIRLALAPHVNHWWEVPLYVTARGLTTSPIPYGTRAFQMDFDFLAHELRIETSEGSRQPDRACAAHGGRVLPEKRWPRCAHWVLT